MQAAKSLNQGARKSSQWASGFSKDYEGYAAFETGCSSANVFDKLIDLHCVRTEEPTFFESSTIELL